MKFNDQSFRKLKIAVIGDLIVDRYIYGTIDRKNPESPAPLVRVRETKSVLGGAWNVRECLDRLGVEALSFHSQTVLSHPEHNQDPLIPIKTRIIVGNQQLIRYDKEDIVPITIEAQERIIYTIGKQKPDCVIVSDYNKGTICDKWLDEIKSPLFIDAHPQNYHLYPADSVIKMNSRELREITGLPDILPGIDVIKQNHKAVIITNGENGTVFTDNCKPVAKAPAHIRNVYDVTGAGDAFMASFCAAYIHSNKLATSVGFANLVAGLSVEKIGSYHPTWAEIEKGKVE